jgi:hypothetical protein
MKGPNATLSIAAPRPLITAIIYRTIENGNNTWLIEAEDRIIEARIRALFVPNRETTGPMMSEQIAMVKALIDIRLPMNALLYPRLIR